MEETTTTTLNLDSDRRDTHTTSPKTATAPGSRTEGGSRCRTSSVVYRSRCERCGMFYFECVDAVAIPPRRAETGAGCSYCGQLAVYNLVDGPAGQGVWDSDRHRWRNIPLDQPIPPVDTSDKTKVPIAQRVKAAEWVRDQDEAFLPHDHSVVYASPGEAFNTLRLDEDDDEKRTSGATAPPVPEKDIALGTLLPTWRKKVASEEEQSKKPVSHDKPPCAEAV